MASDEVFLKLLWIAREKERLGRPNDEVLAAFDVSSKACPTRAEPLHGAARLCRNKSLNQRGYELAAKGLAVPYPHNAAAVEDWIYEYGLLDELAVNAYWTGRYAECADACNRLLSEGKLPTNMCDRVSKNKQFAIDKLKESIARTSSEGARSFAARSFDLFDTLVARRCVDPHEIFDRSRARVGPGRLRSR